MDQTARNEKVTLTVPVVDPEVVKHLRALHALGWGSKRIAHELGIARTSVRRYLRGGEPAEQQTRPGAWTLDSEQQMAARALVDGPAEGNAVVVRRLLAEQDVVVPLRTLQRALAPHRQARLAAELATVRFETAPGDQMQIDFGEKWISIAGVRTKVTLFVAMLGYSRRIFVRASLSPRQDDWREGLAGAFRCFGGVTREILIDRAGAFEGQILLALDTRRGRIQAVRRAATSPRGSACGPDRARSLASSSGTTVGARPVTVGSNSW